MGPELTTSLQAVTCLIRLQPEFSESYLCPNVTAACHGLTLAELHVLVLTSFIKLLKLLQNLM